MLLTVFLLFLVHQYSHLYKTLLNLKITIMKKTIIIILALILYNVSFSQISNNSTRIIGVEFPNMDSTRFVAYDYSTQQYDTLFTLDTVVIAGESYISYDPFRRIIYFPNTIVDTSSVESTFYSLNMNTQLIDSLFTIIDSGTVIDHHYNLFDNQLIVLMQKVLIKYDLTNNTLDTICIVPRISAMYSSNPRYYNYLDQSIMFMDNSLTQPNYKLEKIDISKGIIDTIFEYTPQHAPSYTCFNDSNSFYYGVISDNNNSNNVVKIDPNTFQNSIVTSLPNNFYSHLFQQLSVLDSYRNLYFVPYLDQNSSPFLSITNLNYNSSTYVPYRFLHYQFLDNNPNPILKTHKDSLLKGSFHNAYIWYKNGSVINSANSQIYQPTSSGLYKFSTQDLYNTTVFSNEISFVFTKIANTTEHSQEVKIFPNPCSNEINIFLPNNTLTEYTIFSISGKILDSGTIENTNNRINTANLSEGIYLIRIGNRLLKFVKIN